MFKEFSNPESADYDIKSSLKEENIKKEKDKQNKISMAIIDLVGFLEDEEWLQYGISEQEYLNPTIDTLRKIKETLSSTKKNTK